MMKRKLVRILALILALVTVFTLPVSAADPSNDNWLNVLDYACVNDTDGNYFTFNGSTTVSYSLGFTYHIRHVDIVINNAGSPITSASINGNALTVLAINYHTYRIYGTVSSITTGALQLTLGSGGASYCDVLSFKVSGLNLLQNTESGQLYLNQDGKASSGSSSSSVSLPLTSDGSYAYPQYVDYYATVSCSSWKKYDYLDFLIEVNSHSIDSITAYMSGLSVPFEVSYLSSGGTGEDWEFYDSTTTNNDGASLNLYTFMVRLDLTGLDRASVNVPTIKITGLHDVDGSNGYVKLISTVGWVESYTRNPMYFFLDKIDASIDSMTTWMGFHFLDLTENLSGWFATLQARQDAIYQRQWDIHAEQIRLLQIWFNSVVEKIGTLQSSIVSWFGTIRDLMVSQFAEMKTFLTEKFAGVTDRLDKLIGSTTEGDDLSQGAAEMEEQIGEIQDYEEEQQAVLDDNFDTIQDTVTLTGFTAALAFVQRYINLAWAGIGDFSIIYTLPIFIGLFFFICGRIPGATRWSSRPPKDGDSI